MTSQNKEKKTILRELKLKLFPFSMNVLIIFIIKLNQNICLELKLANIYL